MPRVRLRVRSKSHRNKERREIQVARVPCLDTIDTRTTTLIQSLGGGAATVDQRTYVTISLSVSALGDLRAEPEVYQEVRQLITGMLQAFTRVEREVDEQGRIRNRQALTSGLTTLRTLSRQA